MRKSTVTANFEIVMTIIDVLFGVKPIEPISESETLVYSLINACLLGDPPNKSNPNFLPDFLQKYIKFEKVELSEEQCKKRNEIHFVHKEGIVIAKKAVAMNLIT